MVRLSESAMRDELTSLQISITNEMKFFMATSKFRDGMLPSIIKMMSQYERLHKQLESQQNISVPPMTKPSEILSGAGQFEFLAIPGKKG